MTHLTGASEARRRNWLWETLLVGVRCPFLRPSWKRDTKVIFNYGQAWKGQRKWPTGVRAKYTKEKKSNEQKPAVVLCLWVFYYWLLLLPFSPLLHSAAFQTVLPTLSVPRKCTFGGLWQGSLQLGMMCLMPMMTLFSIRKQAQHFQHPGSERYCRIYPPKRWRWRPDAGTMCLSFIYMTFWVPEVLAATTVHKVLCFSSFVVMESWGGSYNMGRPRNSNQRLRRCHLAEFMAKLWQGCIGPCKRLTLWFAVSILVDCIASTMFAKGSCIWPCFSVSPAWHLIKIDQSKMSY